MANLAVLDGGALRDSAAAADDAVPDVAAVGDGNVIHQHAVGNLDVVPHPAAGAHDGALHAALVAQYSAVAHGARGPHGRARAQLGGRRHEVVVLGQFPRRQLLEARGVRHLAVNVSKRLDAVHPLAVLARLGQHNAAPAGPLAARGARRVVEALPVVDVAVYRARQCGGVCARRLLRCCCVLGAVTALGEVTPQPELLLHQQRHHLPREGGELRLVRQKLQHLLPAEHVHVLVHQVRAQRHRPRPL
mmetsp:Transcript_3163/g.7859  ORF Transcript_3163/g.7859 Transcript_3163/m.7859 type:complete len:247 (-) Transcript_3163:687-1427(-)